jgi:hypothetical protein
MQVETTRKPPATGAERGKLFRARQRAMAMPTDAQLDRVIRQVLVGNIASADMTPAKVISTARSVGNEGRRASFSSPRAACET